MSERIVELPLVDLDEHPGEELRRGLFETGFFLVRDHVIPRPLLDGIREKTLGFMALPDEQKRAFSGTLRGWAPFRSESAAAGYGDGEAGEGDACQKFSMGPIVTEEMRAADPDYYNDPNGELYLQDNIFPDNEMREIWEEYYKKMNQLCTRLLNLIQTSLGLDSGTWDAQTSSPVSVMRFLDYPDLAEGIRMAAHYDDTLLTVLHQSVPENEFAALQVMLPGETEWHSVAPSDDVFVINIGETLTYMSGSRLIATKHRVVAPPAGMAKGSARSSLGYFHLPNWNARLWPTEVEGMDAGLGKHAKGFNFDELLEPDGSVLFYKSQRRAIEKLVGKKEAD